MPDYQELEQLFAENLGTERRPVAIAFRDAAPDGVAPFTGSQPSGCSFWRLATERGPFYTVQKDHYNCPIGSYTHGVPLPPDRAPELEGTLGLMSSIGYLRMEEVPQVFRLPKAPEVIIYAALGETPVEPDVVLFSGRPGQLMLLVEAAVRAGVFSELPLLARPTCMSIPAALANGVVASAGCIGNRVYTSIGQDEMYVAVPAKALDAVAAEIRTVRDANAELSRYHEQRRESLASA